MSREISLWPGIICVCKVVMNANMVFNADRLEISLKTNLSHGKVKFIKLTHGILFFQGRPRILHPPLSMDIKWNSPKECANLPTLIWGKEEPGK